MRDEEWGRKTEGGRTDEQRQQGGEPARLSDRGTGVRSCLWLFIENPNPLEDSTLEDNALEDNAPGTVHLGRHPRDILLYPYFTEKFNFVFKLSRILS
jgi:hypothetical protein